MDSAARDRELALARGLLLASLGAAALLAGWLALRDARALPIFGLLALALVAVWPLSAALGRRGANPGWLLALAALGAVLLIPELGLRLAGFRYESGIQFGYPRPSQFTPFEPHPQLFWTLRPDDPDVNSWGFRGREVQLPKPPDVFRIVVLGDSCSERGYPERLEGRLGASAAPGRRVEVTRLATSGYSSHQGRVAAQLFGARTGADLALVYFGWNDHWRAYGAPDAEKRVVLSAAPLDRLYARALRVSRLVGLAGWLRDALRGQEREPSSGPRVPPERYRENLRAIASEMRGAGARVVFLTAPTSFGRLGVPGYLMEARLTPDAQTVLAEHRAYNQIVREVAREQGAALFDLEARLGALSAAEQARIFRSDGIHFTEAGADEVARQLAEFLTREGLVPVGGGRSGAVRHRAG
jgi:lysophospholipase L1-like esterase